MHISSRKQTQREDTAWHKEKVLLLRSTVTGTCNQPHAPSMPLNLNETTGLCAYP